jgi:tetratricopeptide (TPR) repeat protein
MRISLVAFVVLTSSLAAGVCFGQAGPGAAVAANPTPGAIASPPPPSRWWALLVAAADYDPQTSGLSKLRYCYEDMSAVRNEWLIEAGVPAEQIVVLHDKAAPERRPTKANIERELQAITSRLGPDDVLLLGAAVHGVQLGEDSYICPIDAHLESARNGNSADSTNLIALPSVFDTVARCRAQFKLLIFDACRESLRPAGPEDRAESKQRREFVAALNRLKGKTRGLAVLISCSEGQSAYELDDAKRGAFMYCLLKGLAGSADLYGGNNDGVVSLREAASYANRETKSRMYLKHGQLQEPDLLLGESTINFPLRVIDTAPADGADEDDLVFMVRYGDALVRWSNLGRAEEYDLGIDLLSHAVRSQPDIRDNYARRAVAYRAKGEYSLALADFQKAGMSLELFVRYRGVPLAVSNVKTDPLPPGSRVSIDQIQDDWLWVTAVDNDPTKRTQGWISRKHVVWDPALAELALPLTPQRRQADGAVIQRLIQLANGIAYQPPYVPTSVSLPGLPSRPGVPIPWVYVPDPRWYIPSRPRIPYPVLDLPSIPYIPYVRGFLPF